jgi:hypothetical protein
MALYLFFNVFVVGCPTGGFFIFHTLPQQSILRARAKITSHFQTPMHPAWLRCESLKYLDIAALSRLARQTPQHLKM